MLAHIGLVGQAARGKPESRGDMRLVFSSSGVAIASITSSTSSSLQSQASIRSTSLPGFGDFEIVVIFSTDPRGFRQRCYLLRERFRLVPAGISPVDIARAARYSSEREMVEKLPDCLSLPLFRRPVTTGLDENAGTGLQQFKKAFGLALPECANVRSRASLSSSSVSNSSSRKPLHALSAHRLGYILELRDCLRFLDRFVLRVEVQQQRHRFLIELRPAARKFADLALHERERRQQHGVAGELTNPAAGFERFQQVLCFFSRSCCGRRSFSVT